MCRSRKAWIPSPEALAAAQWLEHRPTHQSISVRSLPLAGPRVGGNQSLCLSHQCLFLPPRHSLSQWKRLFPPWMRIKKKIGPRNPGQKTAAARELSALGGPLLSAQGKAALRLTRAIPGLPPAPQPVLRAINHRRWEEPQLMLGPLSSTPSWMTTSPPSTREALSVHAQLILLLSTTSPASPRGQLLALLPSVVPHRLLSCRNKAHSSSQRPCPSSPPVAPPIAPAVSLSSPVVPRSVDGRARGTPAGRLL